MNRKIIFLGFLAIFITGKLYAQQSTTSSGGSATGEGIVTFTIGQVFYKSLSNGNHIITQGVQQPFEIYSSAGNDNIDLIYSVYPNPTVDFLTLKIKNYNHQKLRYKLYDTNGKLIMNIKITDDSTKVDMNYLSSTTYFMVILNDLKILKSFKIIKN